MPQNIYKQYPSSFSMEETEESEEAPKEDSKKTLKDLGKNKWVVATIVLGVLLLLVLFTNITGNTITGGAIGVNNAGKITQEYLSDYFKASGIQGEVTIDDIKKVSGFYQIEFSVNGKPGGQISLSQDGKYLGQMSLIEPIEQLQNQQAPTNVPKSDKPILEAFVSPYCPYGLQYMKGLVPVFDLLKDKADINIKHIGITHMSLEAPETMKQLCIMNEYNKEKLFNYLRKIIYSENAGLCYNGWHQGEHARDDEYFEKCMAPIITKAFNEINVDENKISNCIENKGEDYFNLAVEYAHSQDVHSSPTPKINGVQVSGRSPELIKQAICSSFNQKPEECNTELSSSTPSPGIGGGSGPSTDAQC